jgi:hypothetical protein
MRSFLPICLLLAFRSLPAQTPDTVPPQLICKPLVETTLTPVGMVTVWATDLIESVEPGVMVGVRQSCIGTDFPQAQSSTLLDLGLYAFDVWVRDAAGNTATCQLPVMVYDNTGAVDGGNAWHMFTRTAGGQPLPGVTIDIHRNHCVLGSDSTAVVTHAPNGWPDTTAAWAGSPEFGLTSLAREGTDLTLRPRKDENPLNGVTTQDLVLIQRHILGIQPFTEPAQFVAADANYNGKVTSLDIVVLKKLILGITDELPNGRSWRFWPSDYVFPSSNPLNPAFPETWFGAAVSPVPTEFSFTGVKIGDVNGSADPEQ